MSRHPCGDGFGVIGSSRLLMDPIIAEVFSDTPVGDVEVGKRYAGVGHGSIANEITARQVRDDA